jgi:hypothetical protein
VVVTVKWVVIALIVIVVIVVARQFRATQAGRDRRRGVDAAELAAVTGAAEEDVTVFGEELQQLDTDLAGRDIDEATRADYQRALDSYEAAKKSLAAVRHPEEVRHVTEILEDGRYAVACVEARVAGAPLPVRRAPCFFNPQHGPSVRDVTWSPAGGAPRDVPACELDAQRVESGAEPDARKVMVGSRRMPYWEAGPTYTPWAAGYFGGFGVMNALFMGTLLGASFGAFDGGSDGGSDEGASEGADSEYDAGASDSGYDAGGYEGGYDGGGYDGGGFDGGGFGGFDGGGFDGGGF